MDHGGAVQSQAVEKYLLGELSGQAREDFESHFFDCEDCAEAVRTGVFFMDNAAAEIRGAGIEDADQAESAEPFWRRWFRVDWRLPAFALSALALLAVSGLWYADHAQLRTELASATSPQALSEVRLDVSRGDRAATVARQNMFFAVTFYLERDTLSEYVVEISGNGVPTATVRLPHSANSRYDLLLPCSRYAPGEYEIAVKATDGRKIQQFPLALV